MKKWSKYLVWLLAVALLSGAGYAFAQNYKRKIANLGDEQKSIQRNLQKTEELLRHTRKNKNRSFNELALLNKQLKLRKKFLNSLSGQISEIERKINELDAILASLEKDLVRFTKSYEEAERVTYLKQDDMSVLLWLFSSDNFQQAYDRMMYFKEFARYRKNQIQLIKRTRERLEERKAEKEAQREAKSRLKDKRKKEKDKLDANRKEQNKLYSKLKRSERTYRKRIDNYRKKLRRIKEQIHKLIIESKKNMSRSMKEQLKKLSKTFVKNKGRLPWPVPSNKAVVTGYFGKTKTATGGQVINDGIFISVKPGQNVRSIFNGKVSMITRVPSYGKVVIIQHGNYRCVYANLEEVSVKKGDDVSLLQNIGKVKTHKSSGDTQLYFQLYHNFTPVNPLAWIMN